MENTAFIKPNNKAAVRRKPAVKGKRKVLMYYLPRFERTMDVA